MIQVNTISLNVVYLDIPLTNLTTYQDVNVLVCVSADKICAYWGRPFRHNEVAPGYQNFSAILIVEGKASQNP